MGPGLRTERRNPSEAPEGWDHEIHLIAADARREVTFALSPGQAQDAPAGRELLRHLQLPEGPADARAGLAMVSSQLVQEAIDEQTNWASPDTQEVANTPHVVFLFPSFDEHLVGTAIAVRFSSQLTRSSLFLGEES